MTSLTETGALRATVRDAVIRKVGGGVALALGAPVQQLGVLVDVGQLNRTDEAATV